MISEGWVEWPGGECPVAWNTCVEYKTRGCTYAGPANALRWDHTGGGGDITKYRVRKREREEQMKETIERLSAYEIQSDREIAAAMKQQAKQIEDLQLELENEKAALREQLAAAQKYAWKWHWMQQHDEITRRMSRYEWLLQQDFQYELLGREGVEAAIDAAIEAAVLAEQAKPAALNAEYTRGRADGWESAMLKVAEQAHAIRLMQGVMIAAAEKEAGK